MIFVLSLLVLLLALTSAWLVVTALRQQRHHERSLRELEAKWEEKFRRLEAMASEKADDENGRNLAAMIDGVASSALRLERRLAALEKFEADGGKLDLNP